MLKEDEEELHAELINPASERNKVFSIHRI